MMELPKDFIDETTRLLGSDEAEALCHALTEGQTPVSVRRNPAKPCEHLPAAEKGDVPWCSEGVYLAERPRFTYDPLLHAGCYYVQEAASMFAAKAYEVIARDFTPRRMLDLCAAPGGKSTLWRSLLPEGSLLVANEPMMPRAYVLAENLAKWGHPDVVCTAAFPDAFSPLGSFFDVVAADVPCSGEGMFRKDEGAIAEWSIENVDACAARQMDIVRAVWPALRQGGYLVYSTCTFNRQENEDNVAAICAELGAETVEIPVDESWQIATDTTGRGLHAYHFFPHRTEGEGLFLALLRKTSEAPVLKEKKKKKQAAVLPRCTSEGCSKMASWLRNGEQFKLVQPDESHVVALRENLAADAWRVASSVRTLTMGVALAETKGKKIIPQHALALSTELATDAFPHAELTLDNALSYLRREALTLPAGVPRGYVVATYEGHVLGFLNNLGSRANNMYPTEWRIRN